MVTVIEITVTRNGGLLQPSDLPALVKAVEERVPREAYQGLAVISGRLPIWGACAVAHALHPSRAVATYDPRLGGGVVVESHHPDYKVGEVVGLEGAQTVSIEF